MNNDVATMTPQERKELAIQNLEAKVLAWLGDSLTITYSTCNTNYFGWSLEEHMYMPEVARRLRAKGYSVSSKVNFEVTDWYIAV